MEWDATQMVEVRLRNPDDFLKIRETLTRIGVASRHENKLYQSCHILHKQGRYFIVSFKEMFMLDGRESNFSEQDLKRRNRIAKLLCDWGLVEMITEVAAEDLAPMTQVKVLPYKEKAKWELVPKYRMGSRK